MFENLHHFIAVNVFSTPTFVSNFRNVRKRETKTAIFCREGLCGVKDGREEGMQGRRGKKEPWAFIIIQSERGVMVADWLSECPRNHKVACGCVHRQATGWNSCLYSMTQCAGYEAWHLKLQNPHSDYYLSYAILSPIEQTVELISKILTLSIGEKRSP